MFKFLVVTTLFAVIANGNTLPKKTVQMKPSFPVLRPRVMNGRDTDIRAIPYQVKLRIQNGNLVSSCGGAIISREWIVTAAHCCKSQNPKIYTVYAGTTDSTKPGSIHAIRKVIVHGNYHEGLIMNDIALMQVMKPFRLDSTCMPVQLYDQASEYIERRVAIASGWGSHGYYYQTSNKNILQLAPLQIISKRECAMVWPGLASGQICAGSINGPTDVCSGDSGGPLTVGGVLVGIVSYGKNCNIQDRTRLVGVYTEIAYFRNWIRLNSGV